MAKKKENKINIKTKEGKKTTPEKPAVPAIWNPLDMMDTMDRWFLEDPWMPIWRRRFGTLIPGDRRYNRWLEPDMKQATIDMIDTGKEFKVLAEMPGVLKEDIEVSITDNNISICGETKTEIKKEDKEYIKRERGYSTICRSMTFPQEVNPDKAEATLKDGILEIKVAKKTPTKGRNIPVK
jgi:HSP20 family protein